jgi:hypothetical protein
MVELEKARFAGVLDKGRLCSFSPSPTGRRAIRSTSPGLSGRGRPGNLLGPWRGGLIRRKLQRGNQLTRFEVAKAVGLFQQLLGRDTQRGGEPVRTIRADPEHELQRRRPNDGVGQPFSQSGPRTGSPPRRTR